MKIVAVGLKGFEENMREIAGPGAEVLMAWDAEKVAGSDLLFVFLHPAGDGRAWIGDDCQIVIGADWLAEMDMEGMTVFVGACYGVENEAMLEALKSAGAKAIIAAPGRNYGGEGGRLAGADWLAKALRILMQEGVPVDLAWGLARAITWPFVGKDAHGYQLIYERERGLKRQLLAPLATVITILFLMCQMMLSGRMPATLVFDSPVSPLGTPTPTPTIVPTWTPWYTPSGWNLYASTAVFATPTPCLYNCEPYTSTVTTTLAYNSFLPVMLKGYFSLPAVANWDKRLNGSTTLAMTVSASDTITVTDYVGIANTGSVTFTLVDMWSPSLSLTGVYTDAGSVVTDTSVMTWTVEDYLPYKYAIITRTWTVLSGTWTVDKVTETLTVEDNGREWKFVYLAYE